MTSPDSKPAPQPSVFADVRRGFRTVARLAAHVKIREDLIPAYAARLAAAPAPALLDEDHHYQGAPEETASYLLALDAVNFGSGYKPFLAKEGLKLENGSIYFTVSTRLKEHFEKKGAPSADDLTNLYSKDVKAIFGLDLQGSYSDKFAVMCADSLRDLGRAVLEQADGSFLRYVEDTAPSAEQMVRRLIAMRGFNDIHTYKGELIPFYKRAQHNVTTLNLQFNRLDRPLFTDIGKVTMFADNAVPKILHVDGILEYPAGLDDRIRRGELIPSGSEEEVEIRGCAGHAVELIAASSGLTATDVDFRLWHKSVDGPRYKATPSHRTLTIFY